MSRKLRLGFLAPANSIHSLRWIKYFSEKAHDVSWISYHPIIPEHQNSLKVRYTEVAASRGIFFRTIQAVLRTRRLLAQIKPDLLHVHSVAFYGLAGYFCGFRPMVATAWGSDVLFANDSVLRRFFTRKVLKSCEVITCDARHMVEAIGRLKVSGKAVRIINFGIDTQKFSPDIFDQTLGAGTKDQSAPVVLSTRSLLPIYDLLSLLEAIPIVLQACPTCQFIIAGTGPEEKMLKEKAIELNIHQAIKFVGRLANDQLPNYYRSATVYVSTALSDAGIAASTAEAMACGAPVVITDSGENREWVEDGRSGFIVPVKNPRALAERVLRLLQDPDLRQRFSKNARSMIMERNDYGCEMGKMEKIYLEVARSN